MNCTQNCKLKPFICQSKSEMKTRVLVGPMSEELLSECDFGIRYDHRQCVWSFYWAREGCVSVQVTSQQKEEEKKIPEKNRPSPQLRLPPQLQAGSKGTATNLPENEFLPFFSMFLNEALTLPCFHRPVKIHQWRGGEGCMCVCGWGGGWWRLGRDNSSRSRTRCSLLGLWIQGVDLLINLATPQNSAWFKKKFLFAKIFSRPLNTNTKTYRLTSVPMPETPPPGAARSGIIVCNILKQSPFCYLRRRENGKLTGRLIERIPAIFYFPVRVQSCTLSGRSAQAGRFCVCPARSFPSRKDIFEMCIISQTSARTVSFFGSHGGWKSLAETVENWWAQLWREVMWLF